MTRILTALTLLAVFGAAPAFAANAEADLQRICRMAPDYVPGFDVKGREVAPADLPSDHAMPVPDTAEFPLTVDLARALNIKLGLPDGVETNATFGVVRVNRGHITYGGQNLTSQISALCWNRRHHGGAAAQQQQQRREVAPAQAAPVQVAPETANPAPRPPEGDKSGRWMTGTLDDE